MDNINGYIKLLPNTCNLIPNAYYQQFNGWYKASCVPEADRSEDQKEFLTFYNWRHTVDPMVKRPLIAPNRPRDDQRCTYDDVCLRSARGHIKRKR